MKQTAVNWLIDWIGKNQYFIGNDLLQAVQQAKAMEKEQIVKAWDLGRRDIDYPADGEQYYNETYNK